MNHESQYVVNLSSLLKPFFKDIIADGITISGITIDSRRVRPGDLFIAKTGAVADGRNFINQALANGAKAVLAESGGQYPAQQVPIFQVQDLKQYVSAIAAQFYQNPSRAITVIGVTGTNGKTSVSQFIAQCLQTLGSPCAVMGTLGYGQLANLTSTVNTTLDSIATQEILSQFQQQNIKYVAMEVSSHGLDQYRVQSVEFDIAVFTNLSRDHLDYHQNMQAYAQAKAKLFEAEGLGCAVINIDDVWADIMLQRSIATHCISYAIHHKKADIRVLSVSPHTKNGIRAAIRTPLGVADFDIPLLGLFNLYNVLATIAVLGQLNISLDNIKQAVALLQPVPGRLQCFGGDHKPLVVVDYAHTPDALINVLAAIRVHCDGKVICVFGCGGDRDKGKRPLMLTAALSGADQVVVTSDNPRSESPEQIIDDILQAAPQHNDLKICVDRTKAIATTIAQANFADIVVIAGKGHEMYQEIMGVRHHFSDIEQVNLALSALDK